MPIGKTSGAINAPTKALKCFDEVAEAQKKKGGQELKSNHLLAIKSASNVLKKEVRAISGNTTWKTLKHRIPELDRPNYHTEAKTLKAAIEAAYGDKSIVAASHIDQCLKKSNLALQAPIQAKSFAEHREELIKRGSILAREFRPGGDIWSSIEDLAQIPSKPPKEELDGVLIMLEADIHAYINENGVLPERSEVLDMVINRIRYIFPETTINLPKFGVNKEIKDFGYSQIALGIKDFPTAKLRSQVEELAKESKTGDFQSAMHKIWSNSKLMLAAYEETLSQQMQDIDHTPTTPDNLRDQLNAKLKLFSPGTKLFSYLKTFNGEPGLQGESCGEYLRLLSQQLLENPNIKLSEVALQAFSEAQKVEITRLQDRDPALLEKVCEPFPDALVTQLKKEREINWVHVLDGDAKKGFMEQLTGDRLKNKTVNAEGFALDFEADANRATFDFDFGGRGTQRAERGETGDAKHLLSLMAKGNKTVQATLSKLINQNGIAMPMEGYASATYNPKMGEGDGPSALIKESNAMGGRSNFENIYTLRDAPNNKVICEYDFVRAGDQLLMNGSSIVPINRDLNLRGDASFTNYAERRKVVIELDRKDLEKGIIKPKFITAPTVELHIKPDWGKLAMMAKEGRLNDFSA